MHAEERKPDHNSIVDKGESPERPKTLTVPDKTARVEAFTPTGDLATDTKTFLELGVRRFHLQTLADGQMTPRALLVYIRDNAKNELAKGPYLPEGATEIPDTSRTWMESYQAEVDAVDRILAAAPAPEPGSPEAADTSETEYRIRELRAKALEVFALADEQFFGHTRRLDIVSRDVLARVEAVHAVVPINGIEQLRQNISRHVEATRLTLDGSHDRLHLAMEQFLGLVDQPALATSPGIVTGAEQALAKIAAGLNEGNNSITTRLNGMEETFSRFPSVQDLEGKRKELKALQAELERYVEEAGGWN